MGCIYSDFNGKCSMWDEDTPSYNDGLGTDWDGNCIVEEDPNPIDSCSSYQNNDPEEDGAEWCE